MKPTAIILGLLLVVACAAPEDSGGPDASAQVACRHWRGVASDLRAGILTTDEVREKVREVHDSARVSEEPGIAEHSEAMLRAATSDDGEAFVSAAEGFTSACDEVGAFD